MYGKVEGGEEGCHLDPGGAAVELEEGGDEAGHEAAGGRGPEARLAALLQGQPV